MDLLTGFIIYLAVFRFAVITAGMVSIIAGYMLFKHSLTGRQKTEIEGQAGEYRLTIRNAAPGTCFALFGAGLIVANFINGGPGLTMKILEKASALTTQTLQRENELGLGKKGTNVVTELTMKGSEEGDAFQELVKTGKAFEENNAKTEAIDAYKKALFLLGEPMNNLASLYLDEDKNDQAILLSRLAVTISPDQAGFLHTHANSLSASGNKQEALQVMEKAARLDPRYEKDFKYLMEKYGQP